MADMKTQDPEIKNQDQPSKGPNDVKDEKKGEPTKPDANQGGQSAK